MTNHLHLAVQVDDEPLGHVIQWVGSNFARALNRRYGRSGHVFERLMTSWQPLVRPTGSGKQRCTRRDAAGVTRRFAPRSPRSFWMKVLRVSPRWRAVLAAASRYCAARFHDSDGRPTVFSQISQLRHPNPPRTPEVISALSRFFTLPKAS